MIRIGKLTDYAMLILSQMARQADTVLSAASLADTLHLTTPTVSKVLKILSEGELVSSVRGAEGGYRLARPALEITVADIIAAMEGDFAMTECCEKSGLCAIDTMCTMRMNWRKINNIIHSLLGKLTIVDMLEPISSAKAGQVLQGCSNGK